MTAPAQEKCDALQEVFTHEEASEFYEAMMSHHRDAMKGLLERYRGSFFNAEHSGTSEKQQWLDVGCGPGNFTKNYLLPLCPPSMERLVAADCSQAMLDHASRKHAHPKIVHRLVDISSDEAVSAFAEREGLFERVCCFLLLHWIRDKVAVLRNIERLIAPGGQCLVVFCTKVAPQQLMRAMLESGKWVRQEHALRSALPDSWENDDEDSIEGKLEGLVASTGLVSLKCDAVVFKVPSPHIDVVVRSLCCHVPLYQFMSEEEKAELEKFSRNFCLQGRCVNYSDTGTVELQRCVIQAYKPWLQS
ncbi:uncharacterized protein LOC144094596 [Amblyomma americanum]